MKVLFFVFSLFFAFNFFAQELEEYGEFELKLIGASKIGDHAGHQYWRVQKGTYKNYKQTIFDIDEKTGKTNEVELGKVEDGDYVGKLMDEAIIDGANYELYRFINSSITTKCKVGLIKRDLSTFKQVGDIVWMGDYGIFNSMEDPNVFVDASESDLYVISPRQASGDQLNYIAMYDLSLSEQWKKDLPVFEEEGVAYNNHSIDANGNVLMATTVELEDDKKWSWTPKVSSNGLVFICVAKNGDIKYVSPELDKSLYVYQSEFVFNEEAQELKGVFITSKMLNNTGDNEALGYSFKKWNMEGELIASTDHLFTLEEYKQNGLTDAYLKEARLSEKDLTNKNGSLTSLTKLPYYKLHIIHREDQTTVVHISKYDLRTAQNKPVIGIAGSQIVFSLNNAGELNWMHFLPYSSTLNPSGTLINTADKLVLITKEYKANFESGSFELNETIAPSSSKNTIPAYREFDPATGEQSNFKALNMDQVGKFEYSMVKTDHYRADKPLYLIYRIGFKEQKLFKLTL